MKVEWVNQIKHLENSTDRNLNDSIDCRYTKSILIGQVKSYVLSMVVYKCHY